MLLGRGLGTVGAQTLILLIAVVVLDLFCFQRFWFGRRRNTLSQKQLRGNTERKTENCCCVLLLSLLKERENGWHWWRNVDFTTRWARERKTLLEPADAKAPGSNFSKLIYWFLEFEERGRERWRAIVITFLFYFSEKRWRLFNSIHSGTVGTWKEMTLFRENHNNFTFTVIVCHFVNQCFVQVIH